MSSEMTIHTADYRQWLGELKTRFRQVQLKAAVAVNTAMLQFYWELGADMVVKQTQFAWGGGFIKQLSADLRSEFPDVQGFSVSNLKSIRQWHLFYAESSPIGQQPVGQLVKQPVSQILSIPWGHNLAIQMLKDPYKFDFLSLSKEHTERELETDLIAHITQFLLELGAGFAYIGRQVPLQVGEREFFLDLLFYHTRLHCHVVVELKTVDFEPEFAGKLNFYIKAVDEQLRGEGDQPTIGLLLCKSKDRLVAEYALSDIQKPMGLATYTLSHTLPEALRDKLPSIEAIERELGMDGAAP